VRSERKELLPKALLELPEVGCFSGEGGAMHLPEGGKPFALVPSEVAVECLVGVYAEELSYDLYGEDLRVGELWGRAALTNAASLESVVYEAEDVDDKGAKIHEGRPPLGRLVWSLPSVRRSSLWFKPSMKLAHGVS
jgi:hypothetical protein